MIRATFDASTVTAAGPATGSRTVAGTAVPYDVPGVISDGRTAIFHRGSLDPTARPVLLRDHDRTRPIGVVADAVDRGDRLDATGRVSRTVPGDEALTLAADGALGMFSVGAEPTDWTVDDAGVLHVHAADWLELSLLTHGAYTGARVAHVTATQPANPEETAMLPLTATDVDPVEPDPVEPDDDDQADDVEPVEPVEAGRPAVVPIAAGSPARRPPARRAADGLTLRAIGPMLQAARAGNARAAQQLTTALQRYTVEAALADVTMVGTDNVGGWYRPAYQPELVDIVSHGAPLTEVIRQGDLERGDFPNKTFLQWTNTPEVALQTVEKEDIHSAPVSVGPVDVPVKTWAGGNDISQQTLDFGPPSFIADYVRAAAVDYALKIDTYAANVLLTAATSVTTAAGDTFVEVVGKLFAALNPANVPAGRMFLAVSWDVAAGLVPVTAMDGPAFWSGSIDLGNFMPTTSVGGLLVVVDANLPPRTYLLGLTTAATWYDTPGVPYTLQAVNVGKLGLDIAVYGYGALGVQYPGALVKTQVPVGP